ncbi:MAG: flavin reductase [Lachnospiraceae bacterium]|jgi:flavin reductase (DIM6/NTAB) family NADH-FMN oxidoreductase RutF|nr:flavin reductase [Lachnospiraceae bacterium]
MSYQEISPYDLHEGACKLIGRDWMLVTAGTPDQVNTMTASWGGLGEMWGKPVAFVVIRPQRYTKEFVDAQDTMSLTFFSPQLRQELTYLGTASGRDEDKIAKAGLHVAFDGATPYFEEAETILIAKKLYASEYRAEDFLVPGLAKEMYPEDDFHTLYICEIQKVLVR